jgi:hypothetical protein
MYRIIGRCLQHNSKNLGGLARVDIPASDGNPYPDGPDPKSWTGTWTTVTLPEEIARHKLLRGEPIPEVLYPLLQPETIQLLRTISSTSQTTPNPQVEVDISIEAFQSCYRAGKENTSSSPSGRHVGHYKAAFTCDALSALHVTMMTILFQAGFPPKWWQRIIDILLEKNPGNARIHRLHILSLVESDFNQAVCIIITRQLTFHMEDNNMIPAMQYGSR